MAPGRIIMNENKLGYDEAVELLRRAVAEKGADYIYQIPSGGACVYRHPETGEPSCIVGHVLAYKGWLDRVIEGINIASVQYAEMFEDSQTRELLHHVQNMQDKGAPWGEAVDWAIELTAVTR